ncbi:nitrite reductase small subunit [Nocardia brasiliensis NBRC 14402]|uniref:Nitrite reductase (NAD(P)H) subunit n=1 Tax=Nocardia brasiliensis (strain ATCC 700358 / HUJEG-1) TaxID=1133849 RepID=K0F5D7_NOCB7|nr:nitrite reductase small subunit NirD [Nocardia brasiliensis]AFU04912.1 nitrite reductase (NAD(P)H) subunit [Nocardia brasiliensis ATCC 700358]ASF12020.1 nitrite reductase (NAD(P)H) small subunit [Nocardia brasiliensis]OCF85484.1 nitrite reductase small subunit [Nocardia brasiliensis]SUB09105.1 Nitrite reductase [NAD(P)H] small subunit [Nocardia brasiliensis]GAJ82857.1 nitrite reductase small subunit [Nocardia brasiliensis NBRC 14402]
MTVIDTPGIAAATATGWTQACRLDYLIPGRGVAVLLKGGRQAALFLLPDGMLYAVGNIDPFGRAAVMSRGIVGDRGGVPVVASPLLKQAFSLVDGRCLDDESAMLPVYAVSVTDGIVSISNEPVVAELASSDG